MLGLLRCGGCGENLDLGERRPKLLSCGHSRCLACVRDCNFTCPMECQNLEAAIEYLNDDLQLVCWLEAFAQGVLECACCQRRFNRVWRRPVALGCGHTACWGCVGLPQDSHSPSSSDTSRRGSLEDFWEYSEEEEEEEEGSSVQQQLVDCPIQGCGKGLRAWENLHLLSCLEGASFPTTPVKSSARPSVVKDSLFAVCSSQMTVNTKPRRDTTYLFGFNKEPMVKLDVWELSQTGPGEMRVKKESLMHLEQEVFKLTGVDCSRDPDWALRLLWKTAPFMEELEVRYPGREHLRAIRDAMPHLRRLVVRGWRGVDLLEHPFRFDEGSVQDTLEKLEVYLPRPTVVSLLRAHRRNLREVKLVVGEEWSSAAPSDTDSGVDDDEVDDVVDEDGFCIVPLGEDCPQKLCWDELPRELLDADVSCLSSFGLLWLSGRPHDTWHCTRLSRQLRAVHPRLAYGCDICQRSQA